jgi:hypothetical protein
MQIIQEMEIFQGSIKQASGGLCGYDQEVDEKYFKGTYLK